MQRANETVTVSEKVNEFIQKHRTSIFVLAGIIAVALVGGIAAVSLIENNQKKAIVAVEKLGAEIRYK